MIDHRLFDSEAHRLVDWLTARVPNPELYPLMMEQVGKFQDSSRCYGKTDLPLVYLMMEQFLINIAQKETCSRIRDFVRSDFSTLLESEPFRLIFEPRINQEILLCKQLLIHLFEETRPITGNLYNDALAWVMNMPEKAPAPLPLGLDGKIPIGHDEWVEFAHKLCGELYAGLSKSFGLSVSKGVVEKGFQAVRNVYLGLDTFSVLVRILPGEFLDREKIGSTTYPIGPD